MRGGARKLRLVTDVPVWLPQWCCDGHMATYTVGDVAVLGLIFEGEMAAGTGPDSIELAGNGLVQVTGTAMGSPDAGDLEDDGVLIASGGLRFAVVDWRSELLGSAAKARCVGMLCDDPTGPTGRTIGRVISLLWRSSIRTVTDDGGYTIDGYEPGEPLHSTAQLPEVRDGMVQMTIRLT